MAARTCAPRVGDEQLRGGDGDEVATATKRRQERSGDGGDGGGVEAIPASCYVRGRTGAGCVRMLLGLGDD